MIVATVAEPVPKRMPTAINQPRIRGQARPLGEVTDDRTDAGVDEHLLEAATGGDEQDAGVPGNALPTDFST